MTDADQVKDRDVRLEGLEYNPGKLWNKEISFWLDGFRRYHNPDTRELLADKERLEKMMRVCLKKQGFISVI